MENPSGDDSLREHVEKFYHSVGKVFSPALQQEIFFTSEGFNHIIFKGARKKRKLSSQRLRLEVLPLAVRLASFANTYQEFEEVPGERYWGIIAIIDGIKFKVVTKQIGLHGKVIFWSVIPRWMTSKRRDMKFFKNNRYQKRRD